MNSFERFNEEKLPAVKYFYSWTKDAKNGDDDKISDGHISIKDYLTCEKVWDKFNMKNMGDYHDHMGDYHDYYLKKNVLQLADIFEKFIGTCLKYYRLDPCHYFSSTGLSWDAMSKMTGEKLEKISDIDKHLFIEKGLRGGISYIAKRHAKQMTNTWMIMILKNRQHLYHTLTGIIYTLWQWSVFLMKNLND